MAAGLLLLMALVGPPHEGAGPTEQAQGQDAATVTVHLDAGTMGWVLVMGVLVGVILVFIGYAKRSA